jgi:hypothetical protein
MRRVVVFYVPLFVLSYLILLVQSGFFVRNGAAAGGMQGMAPALPQQLTRLLPNQSGRSAASAPAAAPSANADHEPYPTLPAVALPLEDPAPIVEVEQAAYVDYITPAAALNSFENMVTNRQSPDERTSAVSSLLQMATLGDPDGRILEALRIASTDLDPGVAAAARDAYAQVAASESARRASR